MKDVPQQHPEESMKLVKFVLEFVQRVRGVVRIDAVMALPALHVLVVQVKFQT